MNKETIRLVSNIYRVNSWQEKNGEPWKPTTEDWKDILPGDYIKFIYDIYYRKPQDGNSPMIVQVVRGSKILFEKTTYLRFIQNFLKHVNIEEIYE